MFGYSKFKIGAICLVIALGIFFCVPNFMPKDTYNSLPEKTKSWFHPVTLGLDLQGGSYLLMQVDTTALVKEQLEALAAKYPDKVKEVRGRGLILGMELAKEGKPVVETCLREHVIVNCTAGNVIRLVPPLIVTKEEIDTVIKALDVALAEF